MRKPIFDAIRTVKGSIAPGDVDVIDAALDRIGIPRDGEASPRVVGSKGIALMHKWEGCRLKAYPDPGSKDGKPWTIGWGSTGPDIGPGTVWTQEQADARFVQDLKRYAADVARAIGDAPTTQDQFDALVAFHYNTGKIASATLTKRHIAKDYPGAVAEFAKWVMNDGKRMQGLVNRRADEAKLYQGKWA